MGHLKGRHGNSDNIADAENITIAGLGTSDNNVCDGFRNNTTGTGNVSVILDNSEARTHTFRNVPANGQIRARIRKILETGTTLATVEKFWLE